jgi:oxepin-CoA hydrolase/3-oxo-5,6-dehydrosuberyl-CoA semialdehyde dehydrogenase
MTSKSGQKCTAIRRALVPSGVIDAAESALKKALADIVVGDPRVEGVKMGPLVSLSQRDDVRGKIAELTHEARIVFGDPMHVEVRGGDDVKGAFCAATRRRKRLECTTPSHSAPSRR